MDASSQHQHDRDHHSQQSSSTAYLNTVAVAMYLDTTYIYSCPCTNSKSHVAFTDLIPPEFIGDDFYCETDSRTAYAKTPCQGVWSVLQLP